MQMPITTAETFFLQKAESTKQSRIGRKLSKYNPMTRMPTPALVTLFCGRVRLLGRTLPQKSVTKAGVGIRVIGLYLESFLPIRDCFVDAAFCKKNVSAVVIGICIIRLQFYSLLVVNHRFIGLSFSGQSVGDVHLHKS